MAFLFLVLIGTGILGWFAFTLPIDGGLQARAPASSLILQNTEGTIFDVRGSFRGDPVRTADLPQHVVDAVLAAEDQRFYEHFGLDTRGLLRAAWVNLQQWDIVQGGSTITQQLAKVSFLTPERTLGRKIQESMIALWLERRLTKDEILEQYLNTIYFGAGAYGIDGAARRYFDKPAVELTVAEAAMLAGVIRAPSALAPTSNMEGAVHRMRAVLQTMAATGALTAEQAAAAVAEVPVVRFHADYDTDQGWFADWADRRVNDMFGTMPVGLRVRTTLDPEVQDIAASALTSALDEQGESLNVGQGAVLVMQPDGAILAMVGGRDYGESQFNRATQALRQPGSAFKLFVYLAALNQGWLPSDIIEDRPIDIDGWQPENATRTWSGFVTLRDAFAHSINSVAVQLSESVGREHVMEVVRTLGIQRPLPDEPSLALGTGQMTLMELCAAYAAMIGPTVPIQPWGISAVEGRGRALYEHPTATAQTAKTWQMRAMIDMLQTVIEQGTGTAASGPWPAGGKTGTTQDYRDAWFVGFVPGAVIGVWVGNDDNSPMNGVSGSGLPAEIFREIARGLNGIREGGGGAEPQTAMNADGNEAVREDEEVADDVPSPTIIVHQPNETREIPVGQDRSLIERLLTPD